jgi:outer membrane lipoprotein carrier protein
MKKTGVLLLLTALVAGTALAATAEEAVANMEKALKSLRTLRARFEQSYHSMSVSAPLKESGEIFYEAPDRMRWEYRDPKDKVFLYRDEIVSLYIREERQLTRSRVSREALESEILAFFLGTKALAELYHVEDGENPQEPEGVRPVKLTPREEGEYVSILLEIDEKTWLFRRAVFTEWSGNRQEFVFSRIRVNTALPPGAFVLKVPPDTEIIEDPEVIRR